MDGGPDAIYAGKGEGAHKQKIGDTLMSVVLQWLRLSLLCSLLLVAATLAASPATAQGASADLRVNIEDSPDPVPYNQELTYSFSIFNLGPQIAEAVHLEFAVSGVLAITQVPPSCQANFNQVSCDFGDLWPGATAFQITATTNNAVNGHIDSTATVSSTTPDPNSDNNSETETTTVGPVADIGIEMSDTKDPVAVGESFSYVVKATNEGPDPTNQVRVTFSLPDQVTFEDVPDDCDSIEGTLSCLLGALGVGQSKQISVPVSGAAEGLVSSTVAINYLEAYDPNPDNDYATETTSIGSVLLRRLTVTKSGDGTVTSSPAGIGCGTDCSEDFADGTQVTLIANPATGQRFDSWGGACLGVAGPNCTIGMNADKSAVARFVAKPVDPPKPEIDISPATEKRPWPILDASATTDATKLIYTIAGSKLGAVKSFQTPASSPFSAIRVKQPGAYTVGLTATGPGGSAFASSVLNVPPTTSKLLDSRLPNLVISRPTQESLSATALREAVCIPRTQVAFGVVEARGCMTLVHAVGELPASERAVGGEWFQPQDGCGVLNIGKGRCFSNLESLGVSYSKTSVQLNGMTITPAPGAAVVLFPASGRVVSSNAKMTLDGGKTLGKITTHNGPLNLAVGSPPSTRLFSFDAGSLPKIGGFSLKGEMNLDLVLDGTRRFTRLGVSMELPIDFSTAAGTRPSGRVSIEADNDRGLHLGELFLSVPEAFLGGVRFTKVSFTYKAAGDPTATPSCGRDWWKATAEIYLIPSGDKRGTSLSLAPPPPRQGVAFCAGGFHSAGGTFTFGDPRPQILPKLELEQIGFNMQLDPTVLTGQATALSGGIVRATGGVLAAFPSPRAPYVIRADDGGSTLAPLAGEKLTTTSFAIGGAVGMALPGDGTLNLGNGYMLYSYPSYVKAGGFARLNTFLFLVKADANLELNGETRRFNAGLNGEVCIAGGISIEGVSGCVGGFAHVSSKGMVACLILVDDAFEPGVGYVWGDRFPHIFNGVTDGCKPSQYWQTDIKGAQGAAQNASLRAHSPGATMQSADPVAFVVKKGDEAKDVELHGDGGAPAVEIRAPDGETIRSVPNEMQIGEHLQALAWEKYDYTWVGVTNGRPGRYLVTPLEGSPEIAKVMETRPTPAQRLKGKVTGKGRKRILKYDVGENPGQKVTFFERGDGVNEQLGTAKRGKGRIRFEPGPGAKGKRRIVAEIEVDGVPGISKTVDTYRAPPPRKAPRVKRVRVKRKGKFLAVSWRKARHVRGYMVVVRQGNGIQRTLQVNAKRHRVRIKKIDKTQSGLVAVSALGPTLDRGPRGSRRFRRLKKPKDNRRPFRQLGKNFRGSSRTSGRGAVR